MGLEAADCSAISSCQMYFSMPHEMRDSSLILVPSGDGTWLAEYRRGPIINYF